MSAYLCAHSPHNEIVNFTGVVTTNTETNVRLFCLTMQMFMTKKQLCVTYRLVMRNYQYGST